jgi:hypothetical protein
MQYDFSEAVAELHREPGPLGVDQSVRIRVRNLYEEPDLNGNVGSVRAEVNDILSKALGSGIEHRAY